MVFLLINKVGSSLYELWVRFCKEVRRAPQEKIRCLTDEIYSWDSGERELNGRT